MHIINTYNNIIQISYNTMNEIEQSINHNDLGQLLQLLELARSTSNQKQVQVFQTLKGIEENAVSYLYLAYLFNHQQYEVEIRRMAGLTMSSALKRNAEILHFSTAQIAQIKFLLLEPKPTTLNNIKSMIISNLINKQNFDFQLLNYLVSTIPQEGGAIEMLIIILQDLKYKSENYNIFQSSEFKESIRNMYHFIFQALKRFETFNYSQSFLEHMKCLNLLTFHCPVQEYRYLKEYIDSVIQPLMILSQDKEIAHNVMEVCFQGLNQIVATKPALISQQMIELIVHCKVLNQKIQIRKIWINILMDIIDNDDNFSFQPQLVHILPKIIDGLMFTNADERNIKEEMEIEYNPYSEQQKHQNHYEIKQQETFECSYGGSGYTLRKISFQLIEKIAIHYSEHLWANWSAFILERMKSTQVEVCQTAISFIGIIAETCLYDMSAHVEQMIAFLLKTSGGQYCSLIRATSLWCLQKMFEIFKQNQSVVICCLKSIFQGILSNVIVGTQTTHLMLKEASVSFLDEIISKQEQVLLVNTEIFEHIVFCLNYALNLFTGRALFNVFKAYSTIFEKQAVNHLFTPQLVQAMVAQLCKKWTTFAKNDSVMCPLMQCLITGFEGKYQYFQPYSEQFLQQIVPLLKNIDRKQLVLRSIDFLSSILSKKNNKLEHILNSDFLENICSLIKIQQKQINNFAFGLISDIAKNYNIEAYVHTFVIFIAQNIDSSSLTSLNNALMCLTDLLTTYSSTQPLYYQHVLTKVCETINTQKLENVYAFNFARIFGRLSLLSPPSAKQYLLNSKDLINFIFLSLRTREVTSLTSDALRGLISTMFLLTREQTLNIVDTLGIVIECLICYPIRRQQQLQPQSKDLLLMFISYTKHLRDQLGQSNWNNVLSEPIFLAGALKTLDQWLKY